MKSLVSLYEHVLADAGTRCGADPSRDLVTIARRTEDEGISFLTITLPSFCQGFERALEEGQLTPSLTPSFGWGKRGLPRFLGGFLCQIFSSGGRLLDEPSIESVFAVRQICLLAKKVLLDCSDERKKRALDAYVQCEEEIAAHTTPEAYTREFARASALVWADILGRIPDWDAVDGYRPKHGPGATQERVRGNAKYTLPRWHQRLEEYFPFSSYGVFSMAQIEELPSIATTFVPEDEEEPVRVHLVPKTLKTPRVIAIEPTCMQYVQQGIWRALRPAIERGRYTQGRVNFTRQNVNSTIALSSSKDRRFATIDLSEASDRVSLDLVMSMLQVAPSFLGRVLACRTQTSLLPSPSRLTEPLKLRKFASMGSALTFPMESMAFFVISTLGVMGCLPTGYGSKSTHAQAGSASPCPESPTRSGHQLLPTCGVSPTPSTSSQFSCDSDEGSGRSPQLSGRPESFARRFYKASRKVYVYGDDIIVPTDKAPAVIDALEAFGLKVNRHKSFWKGNFRESCGMDAFRGEAVKPVYLREMLPSDRRDHSSLVSTVATANLFYKVGYWKTARHLRVVVERILGPLSLGSETSSDLTWSSYSNGGHAERWNKRLMRFERRGWVVCSPHVSDPLTGHWPLSKFFLTKKDDAQDRRLSHLFPEGRDEKHLERSVARGKLVLRRRWVPAM